MFNIKSKLPALALACVCAGVLAGCATEPGYPYEAPPPSPYPYWYYDYPFGDWWWNYPYPPPYYGFHDRGRTPVGHPAPRPVPPAYGRPRGPGWHGEHPDYGHGSREYEHPEPGRPWPAHDPGQAPSPPHHQERHDTRSHDVHHARPRWMAH